MSLDYDLTECDPALYMQANDNGEQQWKPFVQEMIFATISVHIGHLTEANAADFYARECAWRQLHGYTDMPEPDHVAAMIGMRTNVTTDTEAAWRKHVMDNALPRFKAYYVASRVKGAKS